MKFPRSIRSAISVSVAVAFGSANPFFVRVTVSITGLLFTIVTDCRPEGVMLYASLVTVTSRATLANIAIQLPFLNV